MGEIRKKQKRIGLFHFKPKRMGCLTWECGIWNVPKQNAWARRNSKQNALGPLHLDCHGLPEQRFLKKNPGPKPIKKQCLNHMILIISGLVAWGSTLATFLIKAHGGNEEKAKTHWAFCIWTATAYQSKDFSKRSRSKTY